VEIFDLNIAGLTAQDQNTVQTAKKNDANDRRPLHSLKILIVDDAPDNRFLITRILQSAGAEVFVATNGEEGINMAKTSSCDLILMDLQMPFKDGFEATAELRALNFTKPIIALTAHTMQDDRDRCLKNGFDEHVGKPIDTRRLFSVIQSLNSKKQT
jgi:CheY-like chemotaxis protein